MGISFLSRYTFIPHFFLCYFVVFLCCSCETVEAQRPAFAFSFDGFQKDAAFDAEFALFGDAKIKDSAVRMLPTSMAHSGGVLHRSLINFGRKPSFTTDFSFSMSPDKGGNGIAFLIAPANVPKESLGEHLFGLSPGVFAVEFDTSMDPDSQDPNGNHVGIDIGSSVSIVAFNVSAIDVVLSSGDKLQTWIDFDGDLKILEVRLNKSGSSRPSDPFVSYSIDLSGMIWQDAMFVGIVSSAGKNSSQVCTVYSWSFRLNHAAPYLMHSEPLDPGSFVNPPKQSVTVVRLRTDYLPMILMALAFGAACGAAVAFLVMMVWSATTDRRPVMPAEYPPHPVEFGYEKIVVVGGKGIDGGKI